MPGYGFPPLCVGVWFVRPSVLGRPLIDRSQYVRDADERPSPIYLGLDDVPSLNFLVGLCLPVLFARLWSSSVSLCCCVYNISRLPSCVSG